MPTTEEADEAAPAFTLVDAWFRGEYGPGSVPFLMTRAFDGLASGRHDEHEDAEAPGDLVIEARDAHRMHFARSLGSFSPGDLVTKHCAPYGHRRVFFNAQFTLLQKFFDARGTLTHCLVHHRGQKVCVLVEQRYFDGWLNLKLGQDYYQYAWKEKEVK
jgi:hypothetical protein